MLLSFRESCREIWDYILKYAGNSPLVLILSLAAFVYLLVTSRGFRKKMLFPLVVLVMLVLNPLLYSLVYANNNLPFVSGYGLRYWRFLWILQQALLIGLATVDLIRRLPLSWMRCGGLVLVAGIIMLFGRNLYHNGNVFAPATSAYKISKGSEQVYRIILAENPEPMCMFDKSLCAQAREYSDGIKQVWGRNGSWNIIADPEARAQYETLMANPRSWEPIFTFAEQRGVTHIAFYAYKSDDSDEMLAVARQHGYTMLKKLGKRNILHRAEAE